MAIWIISISLLVWCEWPINSSISEISFPPGKLLIFPSNEPSITIERPLTLPEERKLILEWKPILRKGDTSNVQMSFIQPEPSGIDLTDLSLFETNLDSIYDHYTITAESRMDLTGLELDPTGVSGQVLPEGKNIYFTWNVVPGRDGAYEGTIWFYLILYPKNERPSLIQHAVSAQAIDIKVISILGVNSNFWRFLGVFGLLVGLFLLKKRRN